MNLARLVFLAALLAYAPWASALVFAVNEGVTYRVSNDEIRARYAAIATDLSKMLGQPVRIEPISNYKELRAGLAAKAYDLALVHPAHISIEALKSGYKLLAVTKGYTDYKASFLVRADAPYKTLADLRGLKVGAPDEDSITSWMVRATLREALGDPQAVKYTYTRYQDAVPFMVEHTFTQAGATASNTLVKQWVAQGGKVLGTSKTRAHQALDSRPGPQRRKPGSTAQLLHRAGRQRGRPQEAGADQGAGLHGLRRSRAAEAGGLAGLVS